MSTSVGPSHLNHASSLVASELQSLAQSLDSHAAVVESLKHKLSEIEGGVNGVVETINRGIASQVKVSDSNEKLSKQMVYWTRWMVILAGLSILATVGLGILNACLTTISK